MLPPGAHEWTQTVTVDKAISIIGQGTILIDNITKSGNNLGVFRGSIPNSDTALSRISGITVNTAAIPDYQGSGGQININRVSSIPNIRIDHSTFNQLHIKPIVLSGSPLGVIDHCSITMGPWVGGIVIGHDTWKGVGQYGDNSWADDAHYGTDQFVFIEDCDFHHMGGATFLDSESGMRAVVRHCTIDTAEAGNHGTETSQRHRSGRAIEFYENHAVGCDTRIPNNCNGGSNESGWVFYLRGGSGLFWGNYVDQFDSLVVMAEYRLYFAATPWGQADGVNAWDVNSATVFATGTHTGSNGASVLTDSSKHWTTNQYQFNQTALGYSIRNITRHTASMIDKNTSNTITPEGNPQGASMTFSAGDQYEIRQVIDVLDQPGVGKGDLISGSQPVPFAWPHQQSEPVRIWANTLGPNFGRNNGRAVVYSQSATVIKNQDWFYSTDDSAALPGYVPFTYPHPLTQP